eukprot:TRINITY_DN16929_c0_g1_i1.p1 TRINITY_DN16929_c0_g1~~TRINITY_DN16929_c0_g1_i1.p1  ORF type:complete len:216 (+),score=43.02 TRINITY_DN16929_c0_g1_i1:373-1020(+)
MSGRKRSAGGGKSSLTQRPVLGPTGRRPEGTDGSDYQFRMTVDDKYKQIADAKKRLKKLLVVQTMYVILRGMLTAGVFIRGTPVDEIIVAMIAFGAAAAWAGNLGLKGTRPWTLRTYFVFTAITGCLGLWPMVNGQWAAKLTDAYADSNAKGDINLVLVQLVEAGQDLIGVATQGVALAVTFSMANTMGSEKKKKSDYESFMKRGEAKEENSTDE